MTVAAAAALKPPALDLVIDTNVVLDWLAFDHPIGTPLELARRLGVVIATPELELAIF